MPRPRCGKWMPNAGEPCGQAEGHGGSCRTVRGTQHNLARSVLKRQQTVAERYKLLNAYKLERGCAACGYAEDPVALDFDHLEPSAKAGNISALVRHAPWQRVLAELEKCQLLCSNCHRVKTFRGMFPERRRPVASDS